MEISKLNGNVAFVEDKHIYFDVNDSEKKFISVTTLIDKYKNEYDFLFWSAFKALERLIPRDCWPSERRVLLGAKKFSKDVLDMYGIYEEDFNAVQQEILDNWAKEKRKSCDRGTQIHSELENSFYLKPKDIKLDKYKIGGKFECRKDYTDLDLEYAVFPEYLIHMETDNKKFCIAGQIDLLIKSKNDITIVDYKTSKKIDKKGYFDKNKGKTECMQYPLNNLPDTNYWHYNLQLSTYAYMIQQLNPDFVIKDLMIDHYDHNGNNDIYHCDYLKDDVIRMINHYKKQLELEEGRKKRQKREY